jgi:hypothetical protein
MHWHVEAQRFGGLEVDDQLKPGRRFHWKFGRLRAFENAVDVRRRLAKLFGEITPIGDQATSFRIKAIVIDRWDAVAGCQRNG